MAERKRIQSIPDDVPLKVKVLACTYLTSRTTKSVGQYIVAYHNCSSTRTHLLLVQLLQQP